MTSEEFAKKLVGDMFEGQKKADAINAAKGLKPYSTNPLDDWDDDDDVEDYLFEIDSNVFD